jgi:hypothetical protein
MSGVRSGVFAPSPPSLVPYKASGDIGRDRSAEWLTRSKHTDVKSETVLVGPA